jgi:uncharacterized protein YhfF
MEYPIIPEPLPNTSEMIQGEFAFPGPLRDRLVALILAGHKTATTSIVAEYAMKSEPLPNVGDLEAVIDSNGIPVAAIQKIRVRICKLRDVDLQHALDEGEGDESLEDWRKSHEIFWHSDENRKELEDPNFTVTDDTEVVLEKFRVVKVY